VFCAGALVLDGAVPVQGKALERMEHLVRATGYHHARPLGLSRMEDLDAPARVIPGCADEMLHTLEGFAHALGRHVDTRAPAQNTTRARCRLSPRSASLPVQLLAPRARPRAVIRDVPRRPQAPRTHATRFRSRTASCPSRIGPQGVCRFPLRERGDVIIRRRAARSPTSGGGGDDALQGVTDVVRGADLLDSTPCSWPCSVPAAADSRYAHLPLITEPGGAKLAKSRRSVAWIRPNRAPAAGSLALLGQEPPVTLKFESPQTVLEWACAHWDLDRFQGVRQVRAAPAGRS